MEYSIRRYTPDRRDEVVALLAHLWSPRPDVDDRAFRWKYEANPYVAEPIVYVALYGGRVVALRGAYGARWAVGREGRPLAAVGVGDMVVDPEHRNRGLYRRVDAVMIPELGAMGYDYLFNTSLSRAARHVLSTAGWSVMPFIRPLEHPGGGSRVRRALSRVGARLVSSVASRMRSRGRAAAGPDAAAGADVVAIAGAKALDLLRGRARGGVLARGRGGIAITLADEADAGELAAVAATAAGASDTVRHVKDAAYFAWRFHNPLCRYAYVCHRTAGDPSHVASAEAARGNARGRTEGFAVLHAHVDRRDLALNVVDWEAADAKVLERMLRAVIRALPGVPVSIWPDLSRPDMLRAMYASGFAPIADPPPQWTLPSFALRAPAAECRGAAAEWTVDGKSLLALESWSLRMIASDFY